MKYLMIGLTELLTLSAAVNLDAESVEIALRTS